MLGRSIRPHGDGAHAYVNHGDVMLEQLRAEGKPTAVRRRRIGNVTIEAKLFYGMGYVTVWAGVPAEPPCREETGLPVSLLWAVTPPVSTPFKMNLDRTAWGVEQSQRSDDVLFGANYWVGDVRYEQVRCGRRVWQGKPTEVQRVISWDGPDPNMLQADKYRVYENGRVIFDLEVGGAFDDVILGCSIFQGQLVVVTLDKVYWGGRQIGARSGPRFDDLVGTGFKLQKFWNYSMLFNASGSEGKAYWWANEATVFISQTESGEYAATYYVESHRTYLPNEIPATFTVNAGSENGSTLELDIFCNDEYINDAYAVATNYVAREVREYRTTVSPLKVRMGCTWIGDELAQYEYHIAGSDVTEIRIENYFTGRQETDISYVYRYGAGATLNFIYEFDLVYLELIRTNGGRNYTLTLPHNGTVEGIGSGEATVTESIGGTGYRDETHIELLSPSGSVAMTSVTRRVVNFEPSPWNIQGQKTRLFNYGGAGWSVDPDSMTCADAIPENWNIGVLEIELVNLPPGYVAGTPGEFLIYNELSRTDYEIVRTEVNAIPFGKVDQTQTVSVIVPIDPIANPVGVPVPPQQTTISLPLQVYIPRGSRSGGKQYAYNQYGEIVKYNSKYRTVSFGLTPPVWGTVDDLGVDSLLVTNVGAT